MNPKQKTFVAAILAITLGLALLWHWQPGRQVRLHTDHLLALFSARKWDRIAPMISDTYSDQWGFDKTFVLRESREVLRQFFTLRLVADPGYPVVLGSKSGDAITTLRIQGRGTVLAEFAMTELNRLDHPFTLRWIRPGWRPWHWELAGVSHPDFQPPTNGL